MPRFYVPVGAWGMDHVRLSGSEAHHLLRVLRIGAGARVTVFDGLGREAEAVVPDGLPSGAGAVGHELSLPLDAATLFTESLPPDVTVLQAVLKGPRMDLFIEKAAELGARCIIPVMTRRGVVRLSPVQSAERVERWHRIALGAAKQCGTRWVPEIRNVCDLTSALAAAGSGETESVRIVGALTGSTRPLHDALAGVTLRSRVLVLIGPEGDLTAEELAEAGAAGFMPVTFGPRVLRAETAGIFALAAAQYEMVRGASVIAD